MGRFVNGNRIEIKNLTKCSNTKCKYNFDGNCWNANNSYNCGHKPLKKEGDVVNGKQ